MTQFTYTLSPLRILLTFVALPVATTLSESLQAGAKSPVSINGFTSTDKADVAAFRILAGVVVYLSVLF